MCKRNTPTLVDWLVMLARLAPVVTAHLWPTLLRFALVIVFLLALVALMYHLIEARLDISVDGLPSEISSLSRER
jgi:hypothetical protein